MNWITRVGRYLAGGLAVMGIIAQAGLAIAADPEGRLYALPEAGSYDLPVIDRVTRHEMLDVDGKPSNLPGTEKGECAVVSFVYSSCPDANGCPLLLSTLRRLDRALAADTELSQRVRLVSVSFDPKRDTPERLQTLRTHMNPSGDWRFLTAGSDAALRPILDDYGQDALRLVAVENGGSTALIRHVAKVFLVDASGGIRNVYSSGFLDYEILMRDIETLLLSDGGSGQPRDGQ
jgi:cytochrome oxidase Cu insertion factor (SCO1/SenC/PrrC family)